MTINKENMEKWVRVCRVKNRLTDCIAFYLSETVENLTDWDCEHLAMGLLDSFDITPIRKNKKTK